MSMTGQIKRGLCWGSRVITLGDLRLLYVWLIGGRSEKLESTHLQTFMGSVSSLLFVTQYRRGGAGKLMLYWLSGASLLLHGVEGGYLLLVYFWGFHLPWFHHFISPPHLHHNDLCVLKQPVSFLVSVGHSSVESLFQFLDAFSSFPSYVKTFSLMDSSFQPFFAFGTLHWSPNILQRLPGYHIITCWLLLRSAASK